MKASDAKKFIGKKVEYKKIGGWGSRFSVVIGTAGRNIQVEHDWLWAPDIEWMKLFEENKEAQK